jgi:NAD(P)-dependent dehydrogenase (short-subunit alcohol dehydrogenase family)
MSNRLALVFGGTRGIGAACVETLARSGFDVAYTWVTTAPNLPERIGAGRTKGYRADVTDAAQVARAFDDATRDFGPAVHCVVANAGINVPPSPLAQCDPATFRHTTMPSHKGLVLLAASHRVPTIVQKPFAPTWQECVDMVEACRGAGVPPCRRGHALRPRGGD